MRSGAVREVTQITKRVRGGEVPTLRNTTVTGGRALELPPFVFSGTIYEVNKLEALKVKHRIDRHLLAIDQAFEVQKLIFSGEQNVMVDPKVAELISEFDAATNAIAARIQGLVDNGSLNADSQAALQAEVTKLQALGADPVNPVPAAS